MQYLNNLPRGQGHTVFPMLGDGRFSVQVRRPLLLSALSFRLHRQPKQTQVHLLSTHTQPKRLRAVLFCNVLESGEPDLRLLHRADPVKDEGCLKFGINIWVTDKNLQALALSTAGAVLCKDSARLGVAAGCVPEWLGVGVHGVDATS